MSERRLEVDLGSGTTPGAGVVIVCPADMREWIEEKLVGVDGRVSVVTPESELSPGWCDTAGWRARVIDSPSEMSLRFDAASDLSGPEIEIIRGEESAEQRIRYPIPVGGELVIGRDPDRCALAIEDPYISSRHARVFVRGTDVYVEDSGSRWGTLVNGIKVQNGPVLLQHADMIKVGTTRLRLLNYRAELQSMAGSMLFDDASATSTSRSGSAGVSRVIPARVTDEPRPGFGRRLRPVDIVAIVLVSLVVLVAAAGVLIVALGSQVAPFLPQQSFPAERAASSEQGSIPDEEQGAEPPEDLP